MKHKIFNSFRTTREIHENSTILRAHREHLLQFIKNILIPRLNEKSIDVILTGGYATALLTKNYIPEDIDIRLSWLKRTEENDTCIKMRRIVTQIIEEYLQQVGKKKYILNGRDDLYYYLQLPNNSQQYIDCSYPLRVKMNMSHIHYILCDITFATAVYTEELLNIDGMSVFPENVLISKLLKASENFEKRVDIERNITPKKLLGWMKQLQSLLRLKNPTAALELSKSLERFKLADTQTMSKASKQGGRFKKKKTKRKSIKKSRKSIKKSRISKRKSRKSIKKSYHF